MPPRKDRIPVVFDTNIVIGYYLSRTPNSATRRLFGLWRDERKLQLIVSDEVEEEYIEILQYKNVDPKLIKRFAERMRRRETVTHINLGARPTDSPDPDDNVFLATALGGNAKFLITRDPDLLEIPEAQKKKFRFQIVTPEQFLKWVREK